MDQQIVESGVQLQWRCVDVETGLWEVTVSAELHFIRDLLDDLLSADTQIMSVRIKPHGTFAQCQLQVCGAGESKKALRSGSSVIQAVLRSIRRRGERPASVGIRPAAA